MTLVPLQESLATNMCADRSSKSNLRAPRRSPRHRGCNERVEGPHMTSLRALVVLGTRPEAIKQAPVVWALRARADVAHTTVVSTGQHREMLAPMLDMLDLKPDIDLDLMQRDQ